MAVGSFRRLEEVGRGSFATVYKGSMSVSSYQSPIQQLLGQMLLGSLVTLQRRFLSCISLLLATRRFLIGRANVQWL